MVTVCSAHTSQGVAGLGHSFSCVMLLVEVEDSSGLYSHTAVSSSCLECTEVHKAPASLIWVFFPSPPLFQGNIVLAAESEFEQAQWLEMLQESGKV